MKTPAIVNRYQLVNHFSNLLLCIQLQNEKMIKMKTFFFYISLINIWDAVKYQIPTIKHWHIIYKTFAVTIAVF